MDRTLAAAGRGWNQRSPDDQDDRSCFVFNDLFVYMVLSRINIIQIFMQEARNERVLTALNIDQALDARDAFAKALYSSLFTWLVARINHIVYKGTKKTTAISILDIFGFEDFKVRVSTSTFLKQ